MKWKDIRANSKVEQISKFCETFLGFRLVDCLQYGAVTELQKIRDCIIHCLGDASISSDKNFLVKLPIKRQGFIIDSIDGIHIDEQCVKEFIQEIWRFFISVFGALQWEIAAHWQGDKLGKVFERLKN